MKIGQRRVFLIRQLFVLSFLALASCGDLLNETACNDMIATDIYRLSLLTVNSEEPKLIEEAVDRLRRSIKECGVPEDGIITAGGENLSRAETYMLAHLDEEFRRELSDAASLPEDQLTSLVFGAMTYRNLQALEWVLDSGVSVGQRDEVGNTLFMAAVGSGPEAQTKICYLWEMGEDPFIRNSFGFSAIDKALMDQDVPSLQTLLSLLDENDLRADELLKSAAETLAQIPSDLRQIVAIWPEVAGGPHCLN